MPAAPTSTPRATRPARDFTFRPASALPGGVAEQRPDYLLSDFNVYTYNILLVETSGLAGTARYQGDLQVGAGYAQATGDIVDGVRLQGGVRYEDGKQSVTLVDLFGQGGLTQIPAIEKSYWLPAATLTWNIRPDMQLRAARFEDPGPPAVPRTGAAGLFRHRERPPVLRQSVPHRLPL